MLPERLAPFVAPMLAMARRQFPRECPSCRRRYADFESYVRETRPVGTTMDYPFDSMGMISWVSCACGNTLTLRCEEMASDEHRRFTSALQDESAASGRSLEALMEEVRAAVRADASPRP